MKWSRTGLQRCRKPTGVSLIALLAILLAFVPQEDVMAETVTEERNVSGFHALSIAGPGRVVIHRGAREKLVVEASEEELARLVTEVVDGVLRIHRRSGNWRFHGPIRIDLTYVVLDGLDLSGSADVETDGITALSFQVNISGSSNVTVAGFELESLVVGVSGSGDLEVRELAAENLEVTVSGSGDVEARGTVDVASISVRGSGSVALEALQSRDARVTVSGSGNVQVWATERLEATINGSGDVSYRGEPRVVESDVSGSGRLSPD
jgi:carbon monoxide dehydrogenase subunit G